MMKKKNFGIVDQNARNCVDYPNFRPTMIDLAESLEIVSFIFF